MIIHLINTYTGSKCYLFHIFVAALSVTEFAVFFIQLNKLKLEKLVLNGLQERNGPTVFVSNLLSNCSE